MASPLASHPSSEGNSIELFFEPQRHSDTKKHKADNTLRLLCDFIPSLFIHDFGLAIILVRPNNLSIKIKCKNISAVMHCYVVAQKNF